MTLSSFFRLATAWSPYWVAPPAIAPMAETEGTKNYSPTVTLTTWSVIGKGWVPEFCTSRHWRLPSCSPTTGSGPSGGCWGEGL
jgi:hypothetical protein